MNRAAYSSALMLFPYIIAVSVSIAFASRGAAFTKAGNTYTTDGSLADVSAAVADAAPGDLVRLPAGEFTWGAGGAGLTVNKPITVLGAGRGSTIITQSSQSGFALLYVSSGTLAGFTLNHAGGKRLIFAGNGDGWRFTDLEINGTSGRIFDISNGYGLIDNNRIVWWGEQIFIVGKPDAWTSDPTFGTEHAVYIEDNVFDGGSGYTDGHSNAKVVYRNNILASTAKWDAHGIWSNSPGNSSRHFEAYRNTWTAVEVGGSWAAMEWRGGSGYAFFNTVLDHTHGGRGTLKLQEYGAGTSIGYFPRAQGPDDYPIFQQLGTGKDAAWEPCYFFGNTKKAHYGDPIATVLPITFSPIPQQAIDEYRLRIGDPEATYTHEDILVADRDFFTDTPKPFGPTLLNRAISFDGTTGVGIGTREEMDSITPTKVGVGFWVTDEADWDSTQPGPDGQLYTWDGSSWVLKYTPYTYPHPLRLPAAPTNLRQTL